MPLESGPYAVTTADGKYTIGRRRIEDRSLLPKKIVAFEGEPTRNIVSYSSKSLAAGFWCRP